MTHVIDIEQSRVPCTQHLLGAELQVLRGQEQVRTGNPEALTILAMHRVYLSRHWGRDDTGLAMRAEHRALRSTRIDQLPLPSAMSLMLAAARGQQFLSVW